jgi:hypothetical protein
VKLVLLAVVAGLLLFGWRRKTTQPAEVGPVVPVLDDVA